MYGLDTVRLPSNLTTIGRFAFYDDSNLFTVEIPESVTEIDSYAFACPNLTNICCHGATPANIADETVFSEIDKDQCTLYVPEGSVEAYRTATYWKDFKNIKEKYYSSTGINKVNTNSGSQEEVHKISRYSINGQRLNAPIRGINIVNTAMAPPRNSWYHNIYYSKSLVFTFEDKTFFVNIISSITP